MNRFLLLLIFLIFYICNNKILYAKLTIHRFSVDRMIMIDFKKAKKRLYAKRYQYNIRKNIRKNKRIFTFKKNKFKVKILKIKKINSKNKENKFKYAYSINKKKIHNVNINQENLIDSIKFRISSKKINKITLIKRLRKVHLFYRSTNIKNNLILKKIKNKINDKIYNKDKNNFKKSNNLIQKLIRKHKQYKNINRFNVNKKINLLNNSTLKASNFTKNLMPDKKKKIPFDLYVNKLKIRQGETLAILIKIKEKAKFSIKLDNQLLKINKLKPFLYQILLGIDINSKIGTRKLYVFYKSENDLEEVSCIYSIQIVKQKNTNNFKFNKVEKSIYIPESKLFLLSSFKRIKERNLFYSQYKKVSPLKYWKNKFIFPLTKAALYKDSHGESRIYHIGKYILKSKHKGIDIIHDKGTPVLVSNHGKVVIANTYDIRGKSVVVDHGYGVYSGYFHLSKINVKVGAYVRQGDIIGEVGSTGLIHKNSLHWEIRVNNVSVDPIQWCQYQFHWYYLNRPKLIQVKYNLNFPSKNLKIKKNKFKKYDKFFPIDLL